jgi:kinesin family protein 6/9
MVKHNVKVVIRTRPTANFASKNLQIDPTSNHINVNIPKDEHGGHVNNQQESWRFKFDKILHNSSQEDVFDACCKDIVKSVVDGFNGTLLVYGQTGAGKTFTMSGSV